MYNPEDSEVRGGTVVFPPKHAALHPGEGGQYSILRWTAP